MPKKLRIQALVVLALVGSHASGVSAQALRGMIAADPAQLVEATTICGTKILPPKSLPPAGSGPILYMIAPCFNGGQSRFDPEVYVRDIKLRPSRPSLGEWVRYDAATERLIFE